MRPHRLRLQAFGPFAGAVEVDLDALAGSGLFLLHGPTGAGKTTLLDGLGFALYGRVPGVRGKTGRLRSDHADPGVRTEVELEVTLGGRRWRITRSPAQERPKARGTGTTTEQARIHLEELRAGRWVSVSSRIDEASAELDPLLGMSADQFFQVVLLPQGEFAQFLRADSGKRGELLQRLFATERFKAVEDWLVSRRIATAGAVAAARHELDVLSARLGQAAGVGDAPAGGGDAGPVDLDASWGSRLLSEAQSDLASAASTTAAAASERDRLRLAAEHEGRRADLQARRRAALAAAEAVAALEAGHRSLAAELAAAARAAELAAVLDEAAAREADHLAATTGEASARALLAPPGVAVDASPSALVAAAEAARRRSGLLDALRDVATALAAEQDLAVRAATQADDAASRLARLTTALALLPGRRATAAEAVDRARAAAARLPEAQARLLLLTAALREAQDLLDAEGRLRELHEERLLARETLVSLREKEGELREARLVSMVAELAGRLEDGAPCEVCGATVHPDPYEGGGESVTRDDEERARLLAEHAARELADLEARSAAEQATAAGHRLRLEQQGQAGQTVEGLRTGCAQADRAVQTLAEDARGLDAALAEADAVDREQAEGEATRVRLEGEQAAHRARSAEAEQRAAVHAARLAGELDGAPDLATALRRTAAVAAACDAAVEACRRAERAGAEAVRTAAAALSASLAAGFDSPVAAAAARRAPPWRQQTERELRAHDDRRAAAEAALADPETDLPLDPPADPDAATAALRRADSVLAAAGAGEAAAAGRVAQLEQLLPVLQATTAALEPLQREAAQVRRLADLCSGGGSNALRMTLTSFVLAARLEEVAAVASGRLLRMTQGRYSLVHTDGAVKGGARSGLGLLARDSWTGQDRDTSTLSGGETFLASLALALGLADVVQAESGGTRIEALFVDEGFGTLDEETLDEVMDVLDGLREGGRLVGLVSHVAELRARIPAQVRVTRTRTGSELEIVGC